ncbi:MAG: hypothetical protein JNG85_10460 [Spirochaetaceae bacterium]|nr:hypothetical protein [Spirochaetaceae bacterium]
MKRLDAYVPVSIHHEASDAADEVAAFSRERDRIRYVMEKAEGSGNRTMSKLMNVIFVSGLAILLAGRFLLGSLDDILSLECGLLLVSMKIMWMIHLQERHNHFLFWMLHSIEYRQEEILSRLEARDGGVSGRPAATGEAPRQRAAPSATVSTTTGA